MAACVCFNRSRPLVITAVFMLAQGDRLHGRKPRLTPPSLGSISASVLLLSFLSKPDGEALEPASALIAIAWCRRSREAKCSLTAASEDGKSSLQGEDRVVFPWDLERSLPETVRELLIGS